MSSSCDRLLDNVHLLTHELDVVVEVVVLVVEARLYASELGVHVVELVVHVVELVGDGLLCIPMVTSCDGFLFTSKCGSSPPFAPPSLDMIHKTNMDMV